MALIHADDAARAQQAANDTAQLAPPPTDAAADPLSSRLAGPRRFGLIAIAVFFVLFGGWAALAPLAGGAVAPGEIKPDGDRRVVQHLEGGRLAEILVADGDAVAEGDVLVILENARSAARAAGLEERRVALRAEAARLRAELAETADAAQDVLGRDAVGGETLAARMAAMAEQSATQETEDALGSALPAERVLEIYRDQDALMEIRAAHRRAEAAMIQERIGVLTERIVGVRERHESLVARIDLLTIELDARSRLAARNVVAPLSLMEMRRRLEELTGARDEATAEVAQLEGQIEEAQMQLAEAGSRRASEIADRLARIGSELAEITEELRAERDVLERRVVRAPADGRVINLAYRTVGGVVGAGERILEIVPDNDRMIISARLAPVDVDVVEVGLAARVRLTAFPRGEVEEIEGRVVSVSADRMSDGPSEPPYYEVLVEAPLDELVGVHGALEVVPGMQADVLIVAESRTLLEFILEPVMTALNRGMREA